MTRQFIIRAVACAFADTPGIHKNLHAVEKCLMKRHGITRRKARDWCDLGILSRYLTRLGPGLRWKLTPRGLHYLLHHRNRLVDWIIDNRQPDPPPKVTRRPASPVTLPN